MLTPNHNKQYPDENREPKHGHLHSKSLAGKKDNV